MKIYSFDLESDEIKTLTLNIFTNEFVFEDNGAKYK